MKTGDRVRIINSNALVNGDIGTIESLLPSRADEEQGYSVMIDGEKYPSLFFEHSELELVTEEAA